MKEAAGEANMTVITIVLIAIVLAVGTVVVNSLMTSTSAKSCCTSMGGVTEGRRCIFKSGGTTRNEILNNTFTTTYCPEQ